MKFLLLYRHALLRNMIAFLHDACIAAVSLLIAFYLRLGRESFLINLPPLEKMTWIFTGIAMAVFLSMRLYRGLWRFASIQDLLVLTRAVTVASVIFYFMIFLYNRLEGIPRSVPFIHWLVFLAMLGAPRFAYRLLKDSIVGQKQDSYAKNTIPVLLIGANQNAGHFLRESEKRRQALYHAVMILDEDPRFHKQIMHGVEIHSGLDAIHPVIAKLTRKGKRPQKIIIADDTLSPEKMNRLLDAANQENIPLARLPRLTEFKTGTEDMQQIRPIAVEDLLGRAQTCHDKTAMRELVEGRRILVTGAGGSIGSELVRQIAALHPMSVTLLEQSEFNLYRIDAELETSNIMHHPVIADVRDARHLDAIFTQYSPEIVFHAAAIKHVPLSEANPEEAILTNVFGTKNLADACLKHGVKTMVLISTDKAVNPVNVMGATKRLAEHYCQTLDSRKHASTRFITVRFGNVLGSAGSVVPLFERQLKQGGPITVTHPEMLRYFMTISEAVALVLQAAAMGTDMKTSHQGLIFVIDMGQPVRIEELAVQMIRLAGLVPHKDIHIVYTGLRPGEKLYEELFNRSETSLPTDCKGLMIASSYATGLEELEKGLEILYEGCFSRQREAACHQLKKLVPEYAD